MEDIVRKVADKAPKTVLHSEYVGGHLSEHTETLKIRTLSVAIGMPTDELMFSKFVTNFLAMSIMPWDPIITTQSTYLPEARNKIHDIYLEKSDAPYLLMLDSDVLPPPDFINRMLDHNKPIVGGWYHKKEKFPVKLADGSTATIQRPVVYDYAGEVDGKDMFNCRMSPGKGLERVDGAGAGCWLMSREVAEALGKSPYDMQRGGEDLVLCRKITKAGYDIWIDWDAPCAHCGVFWV